MARRLNLRQIEAFKAVMESGTVSRAAEVLRTSQPAMSKLIANLELDTGLKLFDRTRGRLAPTEHALRLHDEIGRIFAGVRQVENAVEAIRREGQGRLVIGVMPALAGSFIQRATIAFLKNRRDIFCSVRTLHSQWIVDRLIARELDIGLIGPSFDNPYILRESLMEHPLVCIMPRDHALASKSVIRPKDLAGIPYVALHADVYTGHQVEQMFEDYDVKPQINLVANVMPTLCEFVAAGLGITLAHPMNISGFEQRLVVRRFEPTISYAFQLCRNADSRNAQLIEEFSQELRLAAGQLSTSIPTDMGKRRK